MLEDMCAAETLEEAGIKVDWRTYGQPALGAVWLYHDCRICVAQDETLKLTLRNCSGLVFQGGYSAGTPAPPISLSLGRIRLRVICWTPG